MSYTFPSFVKKETVEELFRKGFDQISITQAGDKVVVKTTDETLPQFSQHFRDAFNVGMWDLVITKSIKEKISFNTLSQFYCASFFLGMLCRYFPDIWISLSRTEKGDAIYPLVIHLIELIENHCPSLIVEFLASPYPFEEMQKHSV